MSKEKIILILGIWIAVLPYLGFPLFLKNILFSVTGLGIVYLGYIMYRSVKPAGETEEKVFDNFSENNGFEEKNIKSSEI